MKTEILARVADLIRNPEAPMRLDHSDSGAQDRTEKVESSSVSLEKPDQLTLSPVAQKLIDESDAPFESQWEKKRVEKVERVRELVQAHQYGFTPEVVDQVAQKIVGLLP